MDGGILTDATLLFRQASLGWAPVIAPFMLNLLWHLTQIGVLIFLIGLWSGYDTQSVVGGLARFFLGIGFAVFMVLHGYTFVDQWFEGVKRLAYIMGAPPADPSAVMSFGPFVADSIMKSIAEQGFLTYLFSPVTYVYMFAGLMIMLAFALLAAMLMSFLLLSYFLTAACPFFFAFAGTPYTAGLTFSYARMVFGTMAGLFCVILMTAIVSELGALMEQHLRTHMLGVGVTLTWADYTGPLLIGFILCVIFVWLPIHVAKSVGMMVPSWSGGGMLWSFGSATGAALSGGGGGRQTSGSGGGQQQVGASQGSGGGFSGSGNMGAAHQPAKSSWN